MLKKVIIKIKTEKEPSLLSLFDDARAPLGDGPQIPDAPEISEMTVEGKLKESLGRVELKYTETELSGMEGSTAAITFSLIALSFEGCITMKTRFILNFS